MGSPTAHCWASASTYISHSDLMLATPFVALSKFGSAHSSFHISCTKNVAKYLRRTKHWGIRFTCRVCDSSLIPGEPYGIRLDSNLPSFPAASHTLQLTVFVDAPHANDLRNRRSTTGYAFLLSGGAVAHRSKTQTVTATSSPVAELLAPITAAKTAKYLRAILFGLGFMQSSPTPIYIDNISTIQIINAHRPTERPATLTSRRLRFKTGKTRMAPHSWWHQSARFFDKTNGLGLTPSSLSSAYGTFMPHDLLSVFPRLGRFLLRISSIRGGCGAKRPFAPILVLLLPVPQPWTLLIA
jgi:hypothetical protein